MRDAYVPTAKSGERRSHTSFIGCYSRRIEENPKNPHGSPRIAAISQSAKSLLEGNVAEAASF
jgi:hypothetical protein